MDTKQAEILATTFAAWNKLLIDEKNPDEDEIVFEARENWTEEKKAIPRERFFGAIEWMRKNSVTPRGLGKRVELPSKPKG